MALKPPEREDAAHISDDNPESPTDSLQQFPTDLVSPLPLDSDNLLARFRSIVRDEITVASRKLSSDLVRGLKEIGHRTNQLEQRMDLATTVLEGHEEEVDKMNAEITLLKDKLEEAENRARRDNLRIRGIPENITDLQGTATAFFQELAPGIPVDRLEFDRIHRSLAPKPSDGPPRDVIIKFHFYRTKEKLLQAAREQQDISFQGSPLQQFADLSLVTIARRRGLKPYLQILQTQGIRYRWGFPFKLSFSHLGRQFHATSPSELRRHFQELHLDLPSSSAEAPSSSSKPGTLGPSRQLSQVSQRSLPGSFRPKGSTSPTMAESASTTPF